MSHLPALIRDYENRVKFYKEKLEELYQNPWENKKELEEFKAEIREYKNSNEKELKSLRAERELEIVLDNTHEARLKRELESNSASLFDRN